MSFQLWKFKMICVAKSIVLLRINRTYGIMLPIVSSAFSSLDTVFEINRDFWTLEQSAEAEEMLTAAFTKITHDDFVQQHKAELAQFN